MFANTEIKNAVNMYEMMKRDLYAFIVKERKSPLDFEGYVHSCVPVASFLYDITEPNQSQETYHMLWDIGTGIANLLENDLRLWGKTQGIKYLKVAPDRHCESVTLEVVFQEQE